MRKHEVYRLISPSGKSYIGITCQGLSKRFSCHVSAWRLGKAKNRCSKLWNAFYKYPPELWTKEILFSSLDRSESLKKEIEFIAKFDSVNNGYNLSTGGESGGAGCNRSEEFKRKVSEGKKGSKHPPMSEAWRKAQSEFMKSNQFRLGIPHSEETKKHLSDVLKGRKQPPRTEEHKRKISESKKGHKMSAEIRRAMSERRKLIPCPTSFAGMKHTDEAKLKIAAGLKAYWDRQKLLKNEATEMR